MARPRSAADDAGLLDRQRRARLRHDDARRRPSRGHQGRRLDAVRRAPAGTRSRSYSQVDDNDVDRRGRTAGPGANRRDRRRRRRRRRVLARRRDAEHGHRRPQRLGDVGRHEPLDAGRRRRDRARLPGVQAGARRAFPTASTDREGDPEVVGRTTSATTRYIQGAGSVDAGRAVAGRRGHARRRSRPTSGAPATTAAREYPVLPAVDRARAAATTQTFDLSGRRHVAGLRPRAARSAATETLRRSRPSPVSQESAVELQRARLPDRPHRPVKAHPDADLDGDPGELPARRVRRRRRLRDRPGVAAARLQLDRHQPRRPALERRGRRRRRRPRRHDRRLEHRRLRRSSTSRSRRSSRASTCASCTTARAPTPARAWSATRPSGWTTACSSASSTSTRRRRRSTETHFTIQIDFYKNSRLVVADDAADGDRLVHATINVPAEHAVRHVRRRDRRCRTARRLDGRPGRRSRSPRPPRRTRAATSRGALDVRRQPTSPTPSATSSTTTARSSAPTTGRGGRVRRLAVLLLRRPEGAAGRDAVPGRHDVGRRGAVHRPRHARSSARRRTRTSCSAARPDRRAVHPRHGRQAARTRTSAPACGRSTPPPAGREDIVTAPASGGPARDASSTRSAVNGDKFDVPFTTTVGSADGDAVAVEQTTRPRHRLVRRDVQVERRPAGLRGRRRSASASRRRRTETVASGQPERPEHGERQGERDARPRVAARRSTPTSARNDIDLFVLYDANNDGNVHARARSSRRRRAARADEQVEPGRGRRTATTRSGCTASRSRARRRSTLGDRHRPGQRPDGHRRAGRPGPGGHAGDAARHLREADDVRADVQGRAAARPVDRPDGDQRAGDDHAQLIHGR